MTEASATGKEIESLQDALMIAILWACDAEGGYTELTKKYYDWAMARKEKFVGNPLNKELLDVATRK